MAAFGLPGTPTSYAEVDGAWSNRVLRLRTSDGDYAVKELRNPWGEPRWAQWLGESWRLERAAAAAGVAMPEPVPARDGTCWTPVERADGAGTVPVRVHRWVEGTRPSVTDVDLDLAAWAGRTLATLHGLGLEPLDASLFPVASTGSVRAWPDLLAAARSAGAPWAQALAATADAVDRAGNLLVSPVAQPTVLSHGDFAVKNLLVTPMGPVLCDWDVAMPRVVAWDLTDVAVSLAGWRSREVARSVRSAYAAAGGSITVPKPQDLGPTLMVRLDFVSLLIHRALGLRPATAADQAAAHAQLPGLLTEIPHQVSVAETLPSWLG